MKDIVLVSAGCLGLIIAIAHGYLGERKVAGAIQGVPPSAKRVMRAIMFLSAVYWFVGGAVLIASPFFLSQEGRWAAVIIVGLMYLTAAIANFWATRGRHFGWVLLGSATALIGVGA